MKQLLFLFSSVLIISVINAQPGTIDNTFGDKGFVYTNGLSEHKAVAQQADGKIVTAGGYNDADFNGLGYVARFLQDGTLDLSFGKEGFAADPPVGAAYDLKLQKDGKIIIVGTVFLEDGEHSCVARLQTNGSIDSSFGQNGVTLIPDYGDESGYDRIAFETDGSIIIAGAGQTNREAVIPEYSIVSHLSAGGTFDSKFGGNGRVLNYTNKSDIFSKGLAIQKDGKILIAGYTFTGGDASKDYVLSRYNPDGSIDKSFGGGTVITQGVQGLNGEDAPCGIVVQVDGKIVVGGGTAGYNYIIYMAALRYNTDGTLDNSFGKEGRSLVTFNGMSPITSAILLQPDGRLILCGVAYSTSAGGFALARLNSDGSLDESFGVDGEQLTAFSGGYASGNCAMLQSDGKIVQGGSYYNSEQGYDSYLLVRYNNDSKGQPPLAVRIKRFLHNHGIGWQGLNGDVSYYSVQYSKTGSGGFAEKGKVSGAGGSSFKGYDYNVTDAGYYRVVAVDGRGYKTFSNKVLVSAEDVASAASVYPNPARDYVTVQGLAAGVAADISIKDGSGNVLARGVSGGGEQYRSSLGSNMQPGTYYLNVTTGNKTEVLKFVKE